MKILLCSKDINEILKQEIYKQALLRSSLHRLKIKRIFLWTKLLLINDKTIETDF
jgi:hypothetical protein